MQLDLSDRCDRPTPVRAPRLGNALHAVLLTSLALTCALVLPRDPGAAMTLALITATWAMLLFAHRAYRVTGDALNVMSVSLLVMLLLYPFHGLVMGDSALVHRLLGSDGRTYMTWGLLVATAGSWAMYQGFASGRPGRIARLLERQTRPIDDRSRAVERKALAIVAVGVAARALQVAHGAGTHFDGGHGASAGSGDFLLTTLAGFGRLAALYLFGTGLRLRHRRRLVIGLGFIAAEAVWGGLFSGSRYALFAPFIGLAAVYSLVGRRVTQIRLAAGLIVFATVVFPVATAYKNAYTSRLLELQRDGVSTATVLDSLSSLDAEAGDGWQDLVGKRFHALTSLALVIRYTPERHPYLLGKYYALLPLDVAVPRVVWPDKPSMRQFSLDFRTAYFGLDRGARTSVAPSQLGELWANLHLLGVLLGAWIWGRLLRFLYAHLYLGGRDSVFRYAAYASLLPALISVLETEQVMGIATIAKTLVVWLPLAWFLGGRARSTPADSADAGG